MKRPTVILLLGLFLLCPTLSAADDHTSETDTLKAEIAELQQRLAELEAE